MDSKERHAPIAPKRRRFVPAARGAALAAVAGIALTLLLHTQGKIITFADYFILLYWVPPLLLLEWIRRRPSCGISRTTAPRPAWPLIALAATMIVFLFASIIRHHWSYFLHWWPQASIDYVFRSSAFWFVILAVLLLPFFLSHNRHAAKWLLGTLVISQIFIFWRLWQITNGGAVLVRDDHPSFVFRLWQFRETFPQIMTYNPYWNGGVAEHMPLATGAMAPGLLLWPLLLMGDVPSVYTLGFGFLFIVFVPFLIALSLKAVGGDRIAQWTGGILGLGVSQHYFLWLMQYGTIGANLVAAFVVPVSALVYRIVCMDRRTVWTGVFLVLSTCLLAFYPPGALMAAPILLALLANAPRWTWPKIRMLLYCGLAVLLIHFRTLIIFLAHDNVFHFFTSASACIDTGEAVSTWSMETLKAGWDLLLAHLREAHPILLFLGLLGAFFAPRKAIRTWYIPILIGFTLLTGWGKFWAPRLEISRMAIPFMFAAIVPAALSVSSLLRTSNARAGILRSALVALLIVTGLNVQRMYGREGRARYHSILPDMEQMVEWIKAEIPEEGRLLFAGKTVHAYGGGHVAFLPCLTGREMMACDYYHFSPEEVEYDYPPKRWRKSKETIFSFFDLYNVMAVATYHASWVERFRANPEWYEEVTPLGESHLYFFLVKRESSLFIRNQGRVKAHFNRLDVTVENPEEDAVIAYNWAEGLRPNPPAELFPYDAGNGVTLIGIRPQGKEHIVIRYPRWL